MKAILICPSARPSVSLLSRTQPLAAVPFLGESLVEYWLSWLSASGVKSVLVSAHDRPDEIRSLVGAGKRWGLAAEVVAESRELTPAEALLKYGAEPHSTLTLERIAVLDRFPPAQRGGDIQSPLVAESETLAAGFPHPHGLDLFSSYSSWFAALLDWAPHALTPDRVGEHEVRPGVWVGMHCRISPTAELVAPCWLGKNVSIGPGAKIGPEAILEDGTIIEPAARIEHSYVGAHTLVGQFAQLARSVAWGDTLVDLQTGSQTQVTDPFLLSCLRPPARRQSAGWLRRLSEVYSRNKEEAQVLWKELIMNKEG